MDAPVKPRLLPLGDAALLLEFGTGIDVGVNARVLAAWRAIEASHLRGVHDVVPAYASLAVHFDPLQWNADSLGERLLEACSAVMPATPAPRCVDVPVCYDPEFAPDIARVCAHTGLPADEVVRRHAGAAYRVFFLGFTPGFPYLGGLDPALATPRHDSPRSRVPAGSVAIGGVQTGIYPMATPGGWQIIGRTPLRLFDAAREPCCLLAPGDSLRFFTISDAEFRRLEAAD